jgi:hypothetical protein
MSKEKKTEQLEITSFSGELMDFSIDNISIEELDRRLELAVAQIGSPLGIITCTTNCGSYCGVLVCGTNCGGYYPVLQA